MSVCLVSLLSSVNVFVFCSSVVFCWLLSCFLWSSVSGFNVLVSRLYCVDYYVVVCWCFNCLCPITRLSCADNNIFFCLWQCSQCSGVLFCAYNYVVFMYCVSVINVLVSMFHQCFWCVCLLFHYCLVLMITFSYVLCLCARVLLCLCPMSLSSRVDVYLYSMSCVTSQLS